jgi:hypothetical protein
MTLTQEDLLNQRVDDLEEWVGALSDLLSETRKGLAETVSQLQAAESALFDHRHNCSVCGATDNELEVIPAAPKRRFLRALGL